MKIIITGLLFSNIRFSRLIVCLLYLALLFPIQNSADEINSNIIAVVKSQELEIYNEIIKNIELSASIKMKNYELKIFNGNGDNSALEKIFGDLSGLKPAAIVTIGIQASYMANSMIEDIPVIFCGVHQWEKFIVKKKNITGVDMTIDPNSIIKHFKLVIPDLKTVGVIFDPQYNDNLISQLEKAAKKENIKIAKSKVKTKDLESISLEKIKERFSELKQKENIQLLYLIPDPSVITKENFNFLKENCILSKVSLFAYNEEFVKDGALFSLAQDYSNAGSQIYLILKKILTNKINPEKIEVVKPVGANFTINFSTAQKLNLNIEFLKSLVNKIYY
ncbi:MAG TPA: ABC transporter substrate binding protein [bacterium]|nr:ABC transporter substrate binding protein [bacterium]